uniref:protein fantom isoform X2 n=1 Tax=Myxine glutinosa TaxID=7769 RepID=UPI00358EDE38
MADDVELDEPVRDVGLARASTPLALEPRDARERQAVSRLSREDLEDRYLRLANDSLQLKQHVSKQEDKIRRMATKLVRLVNDRKKWEAGAQPGSGRNVDMEEKVEELQTKVRELERQNEGLRSRLLTSRQQLQIQGRRLTTYPHVAPRVNSGLRRTLASRVPSQEANRGRTVRRATQTANGQDDSLLAEAYGEMARLEEVISKQQEELVELQREREEALLRNLRQQSNEHRASMKENLELIRLRREAADKQSALAEIQAKFSKLHQESVVLRAAHDEVLSRLEEMRNELRNERSRKAELEVQLCTAATTQRSANEVPNDVCLFTSKLCVASSSVSVRCLYHSPCLFQMRETMADLKKERDLLKDNYDRLLQSVFESGREQSWRENERQLKLQVTQLEATMRSDLAEKNRLLDTLRVERESNERTQKDLQQLQLKFSQQKQELEQLQERVNFFTRTDMASETLIPVEDSSKRPGRLTEVELQAVHAEILQELEKTRSLLFVQHRINKDYQVEVESLSRQIEDVQREHKGQFKEYARLLDGRTLRIRKLEAQIKDAAYGVRPSKIRASGASTNDHDDDDDDDVDPTAYLSRGENLFEIHLERMTLTDEGARALKSPGSLLFCTYAFYDFELQATPVMYGPNPAFQFTARFSVQPVEAFLDYIQCRAVTLELHTAEGARWRTVADGTLCFNEAIRRHGRISRVATLAGTDESVPAFATLEYWFGLRFPMEQVLMQFHQRQRALGYLSTPRDETSSATQCELPIDESSSRNELVITLLRCSDLSPGTPPPRAYAVHRFYDFPDRDTAVSPPGKSPSFNARATYPIYVSPSLDSYLRRHTLDVYIFDDDDDDELTERGSSCDAGSYLGKAEIPLLPLAHGKDVTGWFELHNSSRQLAGSLEASLCWTKPYRPPIRPRTITPPLDKAPLAQEPTTPSSPVLPSSKTKRVEKNTSVPIASPRKSVTFANSPQAPLSPIASSQPAPNSPSTDPDATASNLLIAPPSQQSTSVITDPTSEDQDPRKHPSAGYGESEMDLEMEEQLKNTVGDAKRENEGTCDEVSLLSSGEVLTMETTDELSEVSEELEAESGRGEENQTDDSESLAPDTDEVLTHLVTKVTPPADYIRVEVLSFHLLEGSAADSSNQQLFVEFSLLGLSTEETETPVSLPKPLPGHSANFNFSKVIDVDREKHSQRRDMLASVANGEETFAIVPFTVVSEPLAEQQELDCVDLGTARLDLRDILRLGKDLTEHAMDAIAADGKAIGTLRVTVEALAALKDAQQDRRDS